VPLSLSVLKGGGGETAAVGDISFVATSLNGTLTGAYTAQVSYMGQTGTISASCSTASQTNKDACEALSAPVSVGGGTFFVDLTAAAPLKAEQASGPWTATGWTYQTDSAAGCGGTATPSNPVRIQF
jgi:hypothetical protein